MEPQNVAYYSSQAFELGLEEGQLSKTSYPQQHFHKLQVEAPEGQPFQTHQAAMHDQAEARISNQSSCSTSVTYSPFYQPNDHWSPSASHAGEYLLPAESKRELDYNNNNFNTGAFQATTSNQDYQFCQLNNDHQQLAFNQTPFTSSQMPEQYSTFDDQTGNNQIHFQQQPLETNQTAPNNLGNQFQSTNFEYQESNNQLVRKDLNQQFTITTNYNNYSERDLIEANSQAHFQTGQVIYKSPEEDNVEVKATCRLNRRTKNRKKESNCPDKGNGKLWEFIKELLLNDSTNPSHIRWERREDGVFKFVQSDKVAKLWGERKQNSKMTYEKLSRAMRYYYKSKILLPVFGRRLVYKFGPNATGWSP